MIGRSIGGFEITAFLGEGGMGSVWRARDAMLERDVALKLLRGEVGHDESSRERLLREARIASRLTHGNIAQIYQCGLDDGELYVAMQLVEGQTLSEYMAGRQLQVEEVDSIAQALVDALAYAHSQKIVHRDISARNVMIEPSGRPMLLDFGLAAAEDRTATAGSGAMGTIPYMPPEVVAGERADESSDQYSFAAVLYHAVTGSPPFQREHPAATLHAISTEKVSSPRLKREALPERIDGALVRALSKAPEARFPSIESFGQALAGVSHDDATVALPLPRARVRGRVDRRAFLIGSAATVLATALGTWWLSGRESAPGRRRIAILASEMPDDFPRGSEHWPQNLPRSLIHRLIQALQATEVVAWEVSRSYSTETQTISEIGSSLRATHLLTSTIAVVEGRIQMTATLIEVETGAAVWTHEVEFVESEVLDTNRVFALGIGQALEDSLSTDRVAILETPESEDPVAWETYLYGQRMVENGSERAMNAALGFFRKAIDRDPDLVEARIGIGVVHNDLYFRGLAEEAQLAEAREQFDRAYALREDITPLRGLIHNTWLHRDFRGTFEVGLEIQSRSDNDLSKDLALGEAWMLGDLPYEAVKALNRAKQALPDHPAAYWFLVVANAWADLPRASVRAAEEYERRFGENSEVLLWKATSHFELGDAESSLTTFERSIELGRSDANNYDIGMFGRIYRELGREEEALEQFREGLEQIDGRLARHPDNVRAQIQRAEYLLRLRRMDDLKDALENLLRHPSIEARPDPAFGVALWMYGEYERGLEIYQNGFERGFSGPAKWLAFEPFLQDVPQECRRALEEGEAAFERELEERRKLIS